MIQESALRSWRAAVLPLMVLGGLIAVAQFGRPCVAHSGRPLTLLNRPVMDAP
jgi:hypothetical protein